MNERRSRGSAKSRASVKSKASRASSGRSVLKAFLCFSGGSTSKRSSSRLASYGSDETVFPGTPAIYNVPTIPASKDRVSDDRTQQMAHNMSSRNESSLSTAAPSATTIQQDFVGIPDATQDYQAAVYNSGINEPINDMVMPKPSPHPSEAYMVTQGICTESTLNKSGYDRPTSSRSNGVHEATAQQKQKCNTYYLEPGNRVPDNRYYNGRAHAGLNDDEVCGLKRPHTSSSRPHTSSSFRSNGMPPIRNGRFPPPPPPPPPPPSRNMMPPKRPPQSFAFQYPPSFARGGWSNEPRGRRARRSGSVANPGAFYGSSGYRYQKQPQYIPGMPPYGARPFSAVSDNSGQRPRTAQSFVAPSQPPRGSENHMWYPEPVRRDDAPFPRSANRAASRIQPSPSPGVGWISRPSSAANFQDKDNVPMDIDPTRSTSSMRMAHPYPEELPRFVENNRQMRSWGPPPNNDHHRDYCFYNPYDNRLVEDDMRSVSAGCGYYSYPQPVEIEYRPNGYPRTRRSMSTGQPNNMEDIWYRCPPNSQTRPMVRPPSHMRFRPPPQRRETHFAGVMPRQQQR